MKPINKYGLLFLAMLLIFPSVVKIAHVFADHEHYHCTHYSDSHFHQAPLDCDLNDFQQVPLHSIEFPAYTIFQPQAEQSKPSTSYHFLSEHQKLSFALRGPPGRI